MRFVIGIDGGGNKTAICIADADGKILKKAYVEALEVVGMRMPGKRDLRKGIVKNVGRTLREIGLDAADCVAIGVGLAGVESQSECENLGRRLFSAGLRSRVIVVNDSVISFFAATSGRPGVVVVAGTGSVTYGRNGLGREVMIGGLGPIIGDEGGGYDIGRKGIIAAIRAEDGRGAATKLVDLIKEQYRIGIVRDIQYSVYQQELKRGLVSRSVPTLVKKAAEAGDHIAAGILRDAGIDLGRYAVAAANRLETQKEMIVAAGGIFCNYEQVYNSFKNWVSERLPEASISISTRENVEGAVSLALGEFSMNGEAHNAVLLGS